MAELNIFIYKQGDSLIHRTHPTFKIILLTISSILITFGDQLILGYFIPVIFLGFLNSKLNFIKYIKDFKYLIILLIIISLFQDSFLSGFIYVFRIFELLLLGSLFIGTTKPQDLPSAIYKIIRSRTITNNIALTISLIPTFLISWKEIEEGLNSRAVYLIKNPLRRVSAIIIPLFIEIFKKADSISTAMESRCYSGWIEESISERRVPIIFFFIFTLPILIYLRTLLQ